MRWFFEFSMSRLPVEQVVYEIKGGFGMFSVLMLSSFVVVFGGLILLTDLTVTFLEKECPAFRRLLEKYDIQSDEEE